MPTENSYTLKFSDPAKNNRSIVVNGYPEGSGKNNYDTSLDLVGPGYVAYGQAISQNFVKVLENFAGPNPPKNAIEGQLWYDTSNPEKKVLRVNNGELSSARWPTANGIYQQPNDPGTEYLQNVKDGDIWVNTSKNQLNIRNGNEWVLVGPGTSSLDNKTGLEVVELEATDGFRYPAILNWANGKVVEVISYNDFTPRVVIDGFSSIKAGVNLTSKVPAKFNGLADRANSLEVSRGVLIKATEVLKNKIPSNAKQTHTGTFVVESIEGFSVKRNGTAPEVKIYSDLNRAFITFTATTTSTNNAAIMRIGLEDHSYISFRRVNQSANEGKIGFNVSPSVLSASSSTITVNGGATFSDKIYINAASSSTEVLIVDGSVNLSGNLLIDGGVAVSGNVSVANTLTTFNIVPASTATYNIGQPDRYFDRIYVRHLGTVTDNSLMLYGYASYASTLTTTRVFKVEGDVESSSEDFNGSQNVTFVVSATSDLILNKPVSTLTTITQTLLVVNTATPGAAPEQISKEDFLADIYSHIFQSGMILPFAGELPTDLPTGWLWCNGDSYITTSTTTTNYSPLFEIANYRFGREFGGSHFRVPNMTATTFVSTGSGTGTYLQYIIKI
jgi:hypothetical protein